jgi:hypothetical protein
VLVILAAIFVPYVLKVREENNRIACRDHLQQLFRAMQAYAGDNGSFFPRLAHDPAQPLTVFAPPEQNPYNGPANNVTGSLWLLVRGGYVADAAVFLCPSRQDTRGAVDKNAGDFSGPDALHYSYASPFGVTDAYRLTDVLKPSFALMADVNPGHAHIVPKTAPLLEMSKVNSPNHRTAGQNVLYAYGSVEWQITPYCGMNNDNIYTVRGSRGSTQPTSQPATESGVTDLTILPSAADDSFLLPTSASPLEGKAN